VDFISELVASTDDEDFAVLLADVECLPDEVLETLAAVVQVRRAGVDRRDDELGQPFAAGRDVAAAVLHPDRHPCPRCDTDDDLDGAEAPRGLAENLAQTAQKQGRKAKCGDREWVWEPCEPWSGAPPDARSNDQNLWMALGLVTWTGAPSRG
jgi:hypothetical protein